jgi:replication factor C subunit 2/4
MLLQNLNYLNKNIDVSDVNEVACVIPIEKIINILTVCKNENIIKIKYLVHDLINNGYPINNILVQLNELIIFDDHISDLIKSQICLCISNAEKSLVDGADEYLQLLNIFIFMKKLNMINK